MKRILASVVALYFLVSIGFAADKGTVLLTTPVDKSEIQKPALPPSATPLSPKKKAVRPKVPPKTPVVPRGKVSPPPLPTKGITPATKGITKPKVPSTTAPLRKVSPTLLVPGQKIQSHTPTINTLIKPATATLPPQPPIIESITFHGQDASGNLIWKVWVNNNKTTEFTLPLWVSAEQARPLQQGMQTHFHGNIPVTTRPLAPGQRVQITGAFARVADYPQFRAHLKSGATRYQTLETQLPPDLTYQAQVVSINVTANPANPLLVRVQNTGTNAIPEMSVQKFCAHSSAPNTFTGCGGRSLSNILPNQIVDSNHALPIGWPTNPNIMKVVIRRGITDFDEKMFYPPTKVNTNLTPNLPAMSIMPADN